VHKTPQLKYFAFAKHVPNSHLLGRVPPADLFEFNATSLGERGSSIQPITVPCRKQFNMKMGHLEAYE
jgi:hypothetical protein